MVDDGVSSSIRSDTVKELTQYAEEVRVKRLEWYQEFLLAKSQSREGNFISDKMAEAMATIATNDELTMAEAWLFILKSELRAQENVEL